MTAYLRAFLSCNSCGDFFRSDTIPPDESIRKARKYARRHGWTRKRVDGEMWDVCGECTFGRSRGDDT